MKDLACEPSKHESCETSALIPCEPIRLKPCYKDYLWGGSKLKTDFGNPDAPDVCAESWELSANPDGMSFINSSSDRFLSLNDFKDFWGTACPDEFPILVKLIDAKNMLSIQVHPSDENALEGEHGKSEMWYVVDAEPQSFIYLGFSKNITKEQFEAMANDGSICNVLNKVPVKRGDVFSIEPGTVHAIGAGIVIAEIQQNSNTTFRIFDYGRKDRNGKTRELNIERAKAVSNLSITVPSECRATGSMNFPEFSMTEMFAGRYFKAYKLDVKTKAKLTTDHNTFQHLLGVEGIGTLTAGDKKYEIKKGDSYFIPAQLGEFALEGKMRLLISKV